MTPHAPAELTATVQPGYTFGASERPTTATLNRLGTPTITISGTLSGTNAGISAGSIHGDLLSASVPDNLTLDFTNSSPQALRIKAAGVKPRELATSVAGAGLAGGAGDALSVTVDTTSITITNDVLSLSTNLSTHFLRLPANYVIIGGADGSATNVSLPVFQSYIATNGTFTSSEYTITAAAAANVAHSLGFKPSYVRLVYVAQTTTAGFSEDDELDALCVQNSNGATLAAFGANATHVFFSIGSLAGTTSWIVHHKTTGAPDNFDFDDWKLKIYARP